MNRTLLRWTMGIMVLTVAAWAAVAAIQRPGAYGGGPKALPPSQLFEGAISEIRGASGSPLSLDISKPNGSTLSLTVDPVETVVLQGGRVAEFETLEKGQQVKARYALKEGKEVARSIEITDPLPMLAPADPAVPAAPEKPISEF